MKSISIFSIAIFFVAFFASCSNDGLQQIVEPVKIAYGTAKISVADYTKTLSFAETAWYGQTTTLSDAALTANGFVENKTKTLLSSIKENCYNNGCTAAATMTSLNYTSKLTVSGTNFVSICKTYGITSGGFGSIDDIRTYLLKNYFLKQPTKYVVDVKSKDSGDLQVQNYIKKALDAGRPVIVRVRWRYTDAKGKVFRVPSENGTILHFVTLTGLKLKSASADNVFGDSKTSEVIYVDPGTKEQTGTSYNRVLNYADFRKAMSKDGHIALQVGN